MVDLSDTTKHPDNGTDQSLATFPPVQIKEHFSSPKTDKVRAFQVNDSNFQINPQSIRHPFLQCVLAKNVGKKLWNLWKRIGQPCS